jgi:hypothetical protein
VKGGGPVVSASCVKHRGGEPWGAYEPPWPGGGERPPIVIVAVLVLGLGRFLAVANLVINCVFIAYFCRHASFAISAARWSGIDLVVNPAHGAPAEVVTGSGLSGGRWARAARPPEPSRASDTAMARLATSIDYRLELPRHVGLASSEPLGDAVEAIESGQQGGRVLLLDDDYPPFHYAVSELRGAAAEFPSKALHPGELMASVTRLIADSRRARASGRTP